MRPLLAVLSLGACTASPSGPADTDTDGSPPVSAIATAGAPGPYRAGFRVSSLDTEAVDGTPTTLRMTLWYPTQDADGPQAAYLHDSKPAPGVLADPTPIDGPLPLAVFSHGAAVYAEVSGGLMAHLASHGWLVAAVDHAPDVFPGLTARTNPIYLRRPRDITALLDHVLDGAEPGLTADPDRILGIGHSFGGYTMLVLAGAVWDMDTWAAACGSGDDDLFCDDWDPAREAAFRAGAEDDRVQSVVVMSGGDHRLFGAAGLATVDVPVLHLTGALDDQVPNDPIGDRLWADLPDVGTPGHVRVDAAHGDHTTFTDFAGVAGSPGASPDGLDTETATQIGRTLLAGWTAWRIDGDDDAAVVFDDPPFHDDLTIAR